MTLTRSQRIAAATAAATAIAIPAEGLRQVAYSDPVGLLTVCYGETRGVERGRLYSREECKALLDASMREAVEQVERCAPGLPWPALAAFADATYNVGPRIVCDQQASGIARNLRAGNIEAACRGLPAWDKARVAGVLVPLPGLAKRRQREMALCLEGVA